MTATASQITLSPATSLEVRRLAAIAYDAWADAILPLMRENAELKVKEYARFRKYCERNVGKVIVARQGERPIGWAGRGQNRNYIAFMFVAPEFQRMGIGSQLLARAETLTGLEGYAQVTLDCLPANYSAMKFYEQKGYRELAQANRTNNQDYSTIRLAKPLSL